MGRLPPHLALCIKTQGNGDSLSLPGAGQRRPHFPGPGRMEANWEGRGVEGARSLRQEITSHASMGLNAGAYYGTQEGLDLTARKK